MPDFVLDPTFSVYNLVERKQKDSILLNHRETMSRISHVIERHALEQPAEMSLYSGFQYMSRFLPRMDYYRKLAQQVEHIYVFGVPDVVPPPIEHVHYVELKPDDALAKEWFIVAYGKEYQCALATEELSSFSDPDELRVFKGVWTFDTKMTTILNDWLAREMGLRVAESDLHLPPQIEQKIKTQASQIVAAQLTKVTHPAVREELSQHLDTSLRR